MHRNMRRSMHRRARRAARRVTAAPRCYIVTTPGGPVGAVCGPVGAQLFGGLAAAARAVARHGPRLKGGTSHTVALGRADVPGQLLDTVRAAATSRVVRFLAGLAGRSLPTAQDRFDFVLGERGCDRADSDAARLRTRRLWLWATRWPADWRRFAAHKFCAQLSWGAATGGWYERLGIMRFAPPYDFMPPVSLSALSDGRSETVARLRLADVPPRRAIARAIRRILARAVMPVWPRVQLDLEEYAAWAEENAPADELMDEPMDEPVLVRADGLMDDPEDGFVVEPEDVHAGMLEIFGGGRHAGLGDRGLIGFTGAYMGAPHH